MKKIQTFIFILFICFSCWGKNPKVDASKIDSAIQEIMAAHNTPSYEVVFVKDGRTVYSQAFGAKSLATGEKLETTDIFRIASISKSFSGVSMMQLVEAGKVSLDDDVNDIIGFSVRNPRYPDIPITVRMLLSHTSSMIDGKGVYNTLDHINPAITDEEGRKAYFGDWAPGTKYQYCNRALNLTGCLIEKISGERFDNYIRQHILLPMGIRNAGFNVDSLDADTFADIYGYNRKTGVYTASDKAYMHRSDTLIAQGRYRLGYDAADQSPTGGMKISAEDLSKWMQMFINKGVAPNGKRIASKKSIKLMTTPMVNTDHDNTYCLTLMTNPNIIEGRTLTGHTGSAYGLQSTMFWDPQGKWGCVCIASATTGIAEFHVSEISVETFRLLYQQFIGK